MQRKESSVFSTRKLISLAAVLGMATFTFYAQAAEDKKTEVSAKTFSLHLGASRVIYNLESGGSTLTVINDQDYPMLVQSEVFTEDRKGRAPFVITPPLFRLDGGQSSRLRIVRTGGDFPSDRETLQWVCVRGVPPKDGDKWAEDNRKNKADNRVSMQVQLSVSSCIKLFVRPTAVKDKSDIASGLVTWQRTGGKLKGTNSTPFYINLADLTVGGHEVKDRPYIAPFSSAEYELPAGATGKVQWKVINDYGGKSKLFEAEVKS
ncbi:TPA: fimbria/pilus periplasmic chaperone [Escherichia coli]|nr:fimbria/pilus periplasmic chaperone [Escherichia coli]